VLWGLLLCFVVVRFIVIVCCGNWCRLCCWGWEV